MATIATNLTSGGVAQTDTATTSLGAITTAIGGAKLLSGNTSVSYAGNVGVSYAQELTGNGALGVSGNIYLLALSGTSAYGNVGSMVFVDGPLIYPIGNAAVGTVGDTGISIANPVNAVSSACKVANVTIRVLYGASVLGVTSDSAIGDSVLNISANVAVTGVEALAVVGDDTENTWSVMSAASSGTWRPVIVR